MYKLVEKYSSDLGRLRLKTLPEFFDYVKNIPYKNDSKLFGEKENEVISRPRYIMGGNVPIDCKKKAILMGAWAKENGKPYKFVAVSKRIDGRVHHVFPIIKEKNGWIISDATYPNFKLNQKQPITNAKVL